MQSANVFMLDTRKETLLQLIVEDYIETAEPVGSRSLMERHGLDVSAATIRSEMAILEQDGYLRQPHTSAGRVPTEKAYRYYLTHVVEPARNGERDILRVEKEPTSSLEFTLRRMARILVERSGETAIVAMDPRFGYYTGVSNLFAKPDFDDLDVLRSVSTLVDQFDTVVSEVYDRIGSQTVVYIGSQNPFGHEMATVIVKYDLGRSGDGLIGLVGPLRMNYGRNIALVEQAREVMMEMYE